MWDLLLRRCLVFPSATTMAITDIAIDDEKIVAIAPGLPQNAFRIIDVDEYPTYAGGIDVHVHTDTDFGGHQTQDSFAQSTGAAAAGGTTTIIDFALPDRHKNQALIPLLKERIAAVQREAVIDVAFHGGLTGIDQDFSSVIQQCYQLGVTSFKMFTVNRHHFGLSYFQIRQVLQALRNIPNGLAVLHAECDDIIQGLSSQQNDKQPIQHAKARPPVSEASSIGALGALLQEAQVPGYFVHVSTPEGLTLIERMKSQGQNVYAETCPHYLLLDETVYNRPNGACFVCSPPLRPTAVQKTFSAQVLRGHADTIASDHNCFTTSQKLAAPDDYHRIPNGLPGVEYRMAAFYTWAVQEHNLSPFVFQTMTATRPAQIMGLYPQKGVLAVGSDADIVVWDPNAATDTGHTHMATDFVPYRDLSLVGRPVLTISRGQIVVEQGRMVGTPGHGKFLARA